MPQFFQPFQMVSSSVPSKPVNIRYLSSGDTSFTLGYDYPASLTGISIQFFLFFGNNQVVQYAGSETPVSLGGNSWSMTMSGLLHDTEYQFIVRATDGVSNTDSDFTTFNFYVDSYRGTVSAPVVLFGTPGPNTMNMYITGDGFDGSVGDQTKFNNLADLSVTAIINDATYWPFLSNISISRINTQSNQSGISSTVIPDPPNYWGTSGFAPQWLKFAQKMSFLGANHKIAIMLLNTSLGSGLTLAFLPAHPSYVTVFETNPANRFQPVLIHEMGHALGGAAFDGALNINDEYGGTQGSGYTGPEFAASNITIVRDRASIKWNSFILPSTPIPTLLNSNCSLPILADPSQSDLVGLFETGGGWNCGVFRPTSYCYMHGDGAPYCPICENEITKMFLTVTGLPAAVTPKPTGLSLFSSTTTGLTFQFSTASNVVYDNFVFFLAFYKTFFTFSGTGMPVLISANTWRLSFSSLTPSSRYMFAVAGHSASGWSRITYGSNKGYAI